MRRALLALMLSLAPASALAAGWPIQLAGTVVVTSNFTIPAQVEMSLRPNGTGTAVVNAAGISQTMGLRWAINPAGQVEILIPGLVTVGGTPVRGCVMGTDTQPTPSFLLPLGAGPTMTVNWNICKVP
ncbi:MAG TPA: hypothetical protein PKA64_15245 [Myxococcota bacterium]|nr:hypothetical protein [Myxococcota bacterium]